MTEENGRAGTLRRIITGLNADGRSVVAHDGPPNPVIEFRPGLGLYEIWTDLGGLLERHKSPSLTDEPVRLAPPPGGIKLRWSTFVPMSGGSNDAQLFKEAFAAIGADHDQPDVSRHPGMHLTHTLDFIIVVEGSLRLILDDDERLLGPGDVVVQRGTNHAWVCEGPEPATIVAVLIEKAFSDQA